MGALDCPSEFVLDLGFWPGLAVTGKLALSCNRRPLVGEEHLVLGWLRAAEGRKILTTSALLTPSGEVLAHANAVWVGLIS